MILPQKKEQHKFGLGRLALLVLGRTGKLANCCWLLGWQTGGKLVATGNALEEDIFILIDRIRDEWMGQGMGYWMG